MPASLNLPITSLPYSTKLSEIGRTFTCTGASHTGNFPAKCSINIPINLSILPKITLWITIGLCFSPSLPIYSSSNLCGNWKSS